MILNLASVPESRRISVLLVDDSQVFLDAALSFLQRHHELLIIGALLSGEEALAQAQELEPQVILVDLNMPGLSGLETIPRLRAMLPQVGIVALTILQDSTCRQAALAAGADDFVPKANLSTALLPAILQVVQARPRAASGAGQPQDDP